MYSRKISKKWYKIKTIGLDGHVSRLGRRYIELSNLSAYFFIALLLVIMMIRLTVIPEGNNVNFVVAALLSVFVLKLNSLRKFLLAKYLLLIASLCPTLGYFFIGGVHEGVLLWVPAATVVFSIIPQLIFSRKTEMFHWYFAMTINLLYVIFVDKLILWNHVDTTELAIFHKHYFFFKIPYFILYTFIHLVFFYFINLSHKHEQVLYSKRKLLEKQNRELESQKEEIKLQNEEMYLQGEKLNELNNNLELMVEEQNRALIETNKKLTKYAFFNAHKVRGPLARILGLVQLIKMEGNEDPKLDMLYESSKDMDEAIKDVNKIITKP